MVGGIVIAAFAVIYGLVLRKVGADNRAAAMELVASQKELRNKGEQDYIAIEKALTAGEAHQRHTREDSPAKDEASQGQYAMSADLVRQSASAMERYRDQVLAQLQPYMEGDSPRIAYAGPRSRKLKLVDDAHLTDEQKRLVTGFIRDFNDTLAVSPRQSFQKRFARIEPVDDHGREDELRRGIPPDQDPPVLKPEAFDEALGISVPQGIRTVFSRQRADKDFTESSLYQRARALTERTRSRRAGQNSEERGGRRA
ncbi:hypothetical protein [Streptomonospora litoralis]|uniref:Uncharacterized protein n=1 Tax=Streptomonospora litoralis TaxID=2498135 RepID=A0A4P6PYB9_9ACTN|nr:hypothetical protein [Streptomonospora litoralis]QBI51851.1 hypothetical protein EKD16_00120 [Streptomonospora litoralis]